jgi:hypothetical protein
VTTPCNLDRTELDEDADRDQDPRALQGDPTFGTEFNCGATALAQMEEADKDRLSSSAHSRHIGYMGLHRLSEHVPRFSHFAPVDEAAESRRHPSHHFV